MPANLTILIGLGTAAVLVGIGIGWLVRARHCAQEKLAVNAGWQEQIDRLVDQNRGLMEQVAQFQADL